MSYNRNTSLLTSLSAFLLFCFSALLLFCFSALLLSPFLLFAQQPYIDIDESTQNRIMAGPVQSCDFYAGMNRNHFSITENEKYIPAYGLYSNQWDTLFIRSEKMEIPFFDNQLKILLVQEGNTPFAFPISGVVSTGYIKTKLKQHAGMDFAVQKKEPVVACFDGVVRIAKKYEEYGNTVVIRHYNGLETVYALLDNVAVNTGQKVNAGELIGYVALSNESKKIALHFETRFLNEFFNPEKIINFSERKMQNNLITLSPNDFIFTPVIKPNPPVIQEEEKTEKKSSVEPSIDTQKNTPVYHIVEKGETIFRICTKYNITEEQLRALNQIKGNNIMLGQKLRVK